jgi:hypothetical protein
LTQPELDLDSPDLGLNHLKWRGNRSNIRR